ncbi:MAG TPA: serine protease [Polyangia bacterium]|jgi:serine protease Do|nr:serine protease [Polyangia bacterium]
MRRVIPVWWLIFLLGGAPWDALGDKKNLHSRRPKPLCSGTYADDLSALAPRVREYDRDARNRYSYCLRTTAVYECLSYAADGSIRRARHTAAAHGTGFAYRRAGNETYVLTNEHVASWPAVTDEAHPVDDVPPGCKRISESIRIVDNEEDTDDTNDISLTPVVSDPLLDATVLKARAPLKLMPYRVGRSGSLRVGNVVAVHGFPLGVFAATNLGKVVNAYDRDTAKEWDHVDFATDALLSPGNSGSPVLALSCRTGEYELVGLYHAGYMRGSALNVVVGIDQLRDLMYSLRRTPPRVAEATPDRLGPKERITVLDMVLRRGAVPYFPLGPLIVAGHARPDGALWYEVYSKGFPLSDQRLLVVEDLPSTASFGELGRAWVGSHLGLRQLDLQGRDGDERAALGRILARLRLAALVTSRYRVGTPVPKDARSRKVLERQRNHQSMIDADAAQQVAELAERLGPHRGDETVDVWALFGAAGAAATPPRP